MKFTPVKQKIAVATLAVLFTGAVAVAVDYEQHQRPLSYNKLTLEAKGEHYRISRLIGDIEKASDDEDEEIYLAFKTRGEFKRKTKSVMFNSDYQELLKQREALFNPPSRKTEGFGYAVLKFLGFKK